MRRILLIGRMRERALTLRNSPNAYPGGNGMGIVIKPSDLFYKYPRDTARRQEPKFSAKPDRTPFDRDDLYEVIPMLESVMNDLGMDDARTLHAIEEIMIRTMPFSIIAREEVFDFLVGTMRQVLEE